MDLFNDTGCLCLYDSLNFLLHSLFLLKTLGLVFTLVFVPGLSSSFGAFPHELKLRTSCFCRLPHTLLPWTPGFLGHLVGFTVLGQELAGNRGSNHSCEVQSEVKWGTAVWGGTWGQICFCRCCQCCALHSNCHFLGSLDSWTTVYFHLGTHWQALAHHFTLPVRGPAWLAK